MKELLNLKKMNKINLEALKAARKQSRELDIKLHGKPTAMRVAVFANKKKYNRKKLEKISIS